MNGKDSNDEIKGRPPSGKGSPQVSTPWKPDDLGGWKLECGLFGPRETLQPEEDDERVSS
jgi:hypothetical protein